jgi:hypothetical protein
VQILMLGLDGFQNSSTRWQENYNGRDTNGRAGGSEGCDRIINILASISLTFRILFFGDCIGLEVLYLG